MQYEFEKIINKFHEINKKGYVQGINGGTNSAGLTFEKLIGKSPDSMFFSDYEGVEIKTTGRFSRYDINLFTLAFDGPELFESNAILEKYGEYDAVFKDKKKLFVSLKVNKKVLVNEKYFFELKIDYNEEKLMIRIYDLDNNLLEERAFIYFDSLMKRIEVKLSRLALIYVSKKKVDDLLFFRYYKIICYKYRGFKTFLKLLETSVVNANLVLRFSRSGTSLLKNKNKNMAFFIKKDSVDKLFEKIYLYEK